MGLQFNEIRATFKDGETHGHVILQATKEAHNAIAIAVSHELSIYLYINISRYSKSWDVYRDMNLHDCTRKELVSA